MRRDLPKAESLDLFSFDGGVSESCSVLRPDRYWQIEALDHGNPLIPRGGGYSYAAASFGAGCLVVDMTRFNRILGFDESERLIDVEAGITLGELLAFTAPKGLFLPVVPGYPDITIGGSVAANVHGKCPFSEGTFERIVESLTLFHPRHGTFTVDRRENPDLFELTCGGMGLTGMILSAKLRLAELPGFKVTIQRFEVGSLAAALERLQSMTPESAFAYTWHDGVPRGRTFGRGFVYRGDITPGASYSETPRRYRRLDAETRRRFPVSFLGGLGSRLLTSGFWSVERARPAKATISLFDATFPLALRSTYFLLFGRRGLAEFQVIVPFSDAESFLSELEASLVRHRAPSVIVSMKLFRGNRRLLRFESDGICVTVDFARTAETRMFLSTLDDICAAAGGVPNLVKDSRLSAETARASYAGYDEFRERIHAFDPERLFRSELSQRLGI
ncbi:MAG TPA: FAD-binding oxidoreductase [Vicinamibacteria bacterium]|nr:FAD-binding oxidoreductase [Vicinamibacteria bacterium]